MNWLYKLAAWFLARDARGTVHCINYGRVAPGWIYGKHGWHINMPNQRPSIEPEDSAENK